MKKFAAVVLIGLSTVAFSQVSSPSLDDQVRSEMSASAARSYYSNDHAKFGITSGYTGFGIDNVARQGFNIDLHAMLAKFSAVRFEVNGGVVLYNSATSSKQESPLYFQSQSNRFTENQFSHPFSLNFALAYIGSDAVYYFSDGKVRPYVAAGLRAVAFQMNQGLAGTLAPSTRAGIEIATGSSFTGFAEARYMLGLPNVLSQYSSSLKYVTTVAFGVSFAPQL